MRTDKNGNPISTDHYTKMVRQTMECPAWRALSPKAQALYPWLKLEWRGPKSNNNGKISLSVSQAAQRLGINTKTAAIAFQELQAKGFIKNMQAARLGINGHGKSHIYLITELSRGGMKEERPLKSYLSWREGCDFPVVKVSAPAKKNSRSNNRID